MWVSDVLPGRVNDLAAAKEHVFAVLRPFTGQMPCLADGGYEPAGHGICTPGQEGPGEDRTWTSAPRPATCCIRSLRCLGERGFALLTQRWQALQHVTASPGRIGDIARAALVLTLFEHKMLDLKSLRKPQCAQVAVSSCCTGRSASRTTTSMPNYRHAE